MWLADSGTVGPATLADPWAAARRLHSAWETYHTTGRLPAGVRGVVAESWRRSRAAAVDAALQAVTPKPDRAGSPRWEAELRAAGSALLARLTHELEGSRHLVALSDAEGTLLAVHGERSVVARPARQGFIAGARWDEASCGTNAVGTALATGAPVQIFSAEHFCEGWNSYACSAAPVRHPVTGALLGVVDVTGPADRINGHTYSLARLAAVEVQDELRRQLGGRDRELLARFLCSSAEPGHLVLTLDARGEIVLANDLGLQQIQSRDLIRVRTLGRQALAGGGDRCELLELAQGPMLVRVDLVQFGGDSIGALLTARLERPWRRPAVAPTAPALGLTGASQLLLDARRRAVRIWEAADRPLLLCGEAGTGKTLLAGRLLGTLDTEIATAAVDAFDPDWWSSLARALQGGEAVVLEHVDELSAVEQRRLSARLDAGPDRLILTSSSRRDELQRALANRLAAGTVTLPPLRERPGDLPLLIDAWCAREEQRRPPRLTVTAAARERLARHVWPGNVGELFGVLDAARLVRRGAAMDAADLELAEACTEVGSAPGDDGTFDELQLRALRGTLRRTGGNVSAAARMLGVSRSTLHRRLNSYRLRGVSDI